MELGFTPKCARLQGSDTLCCLTLLNNRENPPQADCPVSMQTTGTPTSHRALPHDTMRGASPYCFWSKTQALPLSLDPFLRGVGKLLRAFLIIKSKVVDSSGLETFCRLPLIPTALCSKARACVCMLSHVNLFVTPWPVARQAPLSMGFPRQEY